MNKINNKVIISALTILAILAFGAIVAPKIANADTAGYVTSYGSTGFNDVQSNNQYNAYQGPDNSDNSNNSNNNSNPIYISAPTPAPIYINPAPTPAPIVYYVTNPTTTTITAPKTVATVKTTPVEDTDAYTYDSSLAANTIYGSDGFLPSGIVQWILFAILVLIIVILVRKIFGADKRYHATPMKHA